MRTSSLWPHAILPQICTVWCKKLRKNFNAIMEVFYCFTVAIGLPGDASDYCRRKKDRQLQRACKQRWLSSEATVRATVEVRFRCLGGTEAAVGKQKWCNVRCFTRTYKNKNFQIGSFLLSTFSPHLTELSKVFQAGCFYLAQMKPSTELCINKLSDAAA